jgi:hypothetical protein
LISSGAAASVSSVLVPTDLTRLQDINLSGPRQRDQVLALIGGVSVSVKQAVAIFAGTDFDSQTISSMKREGINFGADTGGRHFNLDRGIVLFAPKSDIVVSTRQGDVHINSGAIVLIFEDGQDVAVFDLCDPRQGAVKFVTAGNVLPLSPGVEVVLTTKSSGTFNDVNPAKSVACRNVEKIALKNVIIAYISEFSIVSALSTAHLYKRLAQMHPAAALNKIMTTAASMHVITPGRGAYSASP